MVDLSVSSSKTASVDGVTVAVVPPGGNATIQVDVSSCADPSVDTTCTAVQDDVEVMVGGRQRCDLVQQTLWHCCGDTTVWGLCLATYICWKEVRCCCTSLQLEITSHQ